MMDQNLIVHVVCVSFLIFGSLAAQCHRRWSREYRNECVSRERVPLNHATVHLAFVEGFVWHEFQLPDYYQRLIQSLESDCSSSTDPGRVASLMSRVWHFVIVFQCYMSTFFFVGWLKLFIPIKFTFNVCKIFLSHLPQRHETRPVCRVSFSCVAISSFRVQFDSRLWLSISPHRHGASTTLPRWAPIRMWAVRVPIKVK
jgi:hypothetical protein